MQRLVFTSTIDVVIGFDEIIDGDESLPVPTHFLFPGYPDTKQRAEKMVLEANGRELACGRLIYFLISRLSNGNYTSCNDPKSGRLRNIMVKQMMQKQDFQ